MHGYQNCNLPPEFWDLLNHGEMVECHLTPTGSNYTFYAILLNEMQQRCPVVYKPQGGETQLWDFPEGTLYLREHAAYILSQELGWGIIPPTTIREGVYGIGSVQLYIMADPRLNYFTFGETYRDDLLKICVFDVIANNADRKASHCLLDAKGSIWAIDHGITFHSETKLRTVIWDFAGQEVPERIMADMENLLGNFDEPGRLHEKLTTLLPYEEIQALRNRMEGLLESPFFPFPSSPRSVPWPWI